jgi:hypothetical protein
LPNRRSVLFFPRRSGPKLGEQLLELHQIRVFSLNRAELTIVIDWCGNTRLLVRSVPAFFADDGDRWRSRDAQPDSGAFDGDHGDCKATDHMIESFRNELWPGYKTGLGIEPALHAQFVPLEKALLAMGVATWPMVELEADDALASAANIAARDPVVENVCIWTPDKDLAQCVSGARVVQVDRRSGQIRDDAAVRAKFGVAPSHIADYLALVGDAADGYPGIPKIGAKTAARLITRYGAIEQFPRTSSATTWSARCSLRNWRRCVPTRRSSPTSRRCAGAERRTRSLARPSISVHRAL